MRSSKTSNCMPSWVRCGGDIPADGLLISCAGIQISPVLAEIEAAFGRPVIASNQAVVWHCLRLLQIADRPPGHGDLLAGRFG